MAKNSMNFNVNFSSSFDSSAITKGLQEIRKQMGSISSDGQIFKGVDKELSKLENQLADLEVARDQMDDPKGMQRYQKALDQVRQTATKIGVDFRAIANSDAFKFKAAEEGKKRIIAIQVQMGALQGTLKDQQKSLAASLADNLGIENKTAKAIAETITNESDLTKELEKEVRIGTQRLNQIREEEKLKNQEKANSALSAFQSQKKIVKNNIEDKGSFRNKGDAVGFVGSTIDTAFKQGLEQGKSFAEVWTQITQTLANAGVQVNNFTELEGKLNLKFQDLQTIWAGDTKESNKYAEQLKRIGVVGEDGRVILSNVSQEILKQGSSIQKTNENIREQEQRIEDLNRETEEQVKEQDKVRQSSNESAQAQVQNTKEVINQEKKDVSEKQRTLEAQEKITASIKNTTERLKNFFSISNGWMKLRQIISQTFQDVQRLDKAFASIAMVTDKTVSGLWDTYDQYSEMANRLGQTTESAIQASALFYQQGHCLTMMLVS